MFMILDWLAYTTDESQLVRDFRVLEEADVLNIWNKAIYIYHILHSDQ
jgi:hypothetical protein